VTNSKQHNEKIRGFILSQVFFMKCVQKTHKGLLFVQAYSWNIEMTRKSKGKGKVYPKMSHEGPEGKAEV